MSFDQLLAISRSSQLTYRGVPILKNPLDLWIYTELIAKHRPQRIIETGSWMGGSAMFLRDTCRNLDLDTEIVTIDIKSIPPRKGVIILTGSSVDPAIVEQLASVPETMVILDSDHSSEHVLAELKVYSKILGDDQYLVVEDTIVGGPHQAVRVFLQAHRHDFELDSMPYLFGMDLTSNPDGFIRRRESNGLFKQDEDGTLE